MKSVSELMTEIDKTLHYQQNIKETLEVFNGHNINALPVINENGEIAGLVTKDDLLTLITKNINSSSGNTFKTKIKDIIKKDIVTIKKDTPLRKVITLNYEFFLIIDEDEQFCGLLTKNQITHHLFKEANYMLKDLYTIIDSAYNGIIATNIEGIITIFNHAAEKITCKSKKEVVGKHFSELDIPQRLLNAPLEEANQLNYKFSLEYSTGKHIYLTTQSPILENGQVVGAVGIFQDISDIEFITGELESVKQLNEELNSIIESSYDGILISDIAGIIIKANQAHANIMGISSDKVEGRYFHELVQEGIYTKSIVNDVLREKKSVTLIEQTPSQNHLLITGNPVRNKLGEIFRVVINIRDITELNMLRNELEVNKDLRERYHSELTQLRGKLLNQEGLVFNSQKMQELLSTALRVAQVDSTVLILGESGVGKEIIAKLIHNNSNRDKEPFIPVNCATIPENLLESELFGYERGAFTGANKDGKPGMFELADNGTLFLDEIGELSLSFQVKLLRVIQEKKVLRVGGTRHRSINVRLIAATNQNLESLIQKGEFRQDLYFRLNVVPVIIPPLRERRDDIIPLIYTFKKDFENKYNITKEFSPEVFEIFLNYSWPGNIRELENVIERLMVTSPGATITSEQLPCQLSEITSTQSSNIVSANGIIPLKDAVTEIERQIISKALKQYNSTYKAAQALQVDQSTVVRKIKQIKEKGLEI